ncbi:MAG: hypothetical protein D6805_10050 [Planctomycetota bacterium]|nr:MAG: hypothetical protein D6805_10050 [Planctomycetota bacterium]
MVAFKSGKILAYFFLVSLFAFFFPIETAEGKAILRLQLLEIYAKKSGEWKPPKRRIDKRLKTKYKWAWKRLQRQKEYKKYLWNVYQLVQDKVLSLFLRKKQGYPLPHHFFLELTCLKKQKRDFYLKIKIQKKVEKKFKSVAELVQKIRLKSTLLICLELRRGALYLALRIYQSKKPPKKSPKNKAA